MLLWLFCSPLFFSFSTTCTILSEGQIFVFVSLLLLPRNKARWDPVKPVRSQTSFLQRFKANSRWRWFLSTNHITAFTGWMAKRHWQTPYARKSKTRSIKLAFHLRINSRESTFLCVDWRGILLVIVNSPWDNRKIQFARVYSQVQNRS